MAFYLSSCAIHLSSESNALSEKSKESNNTIGLVSYKATELLVKLVPGTNLNKWVVKYGGQKKSTLLSDPDMHILVFQSRSDALAAKEKMVADESVLETYFNDKSMNVPYEID